MICAHTVRKVKPGQAKAFIEAFRPPETRAGRPRAGSASSRSKARATPTPS